MRSMHSTDALAVDRSEPKRFGVEMDTANRATSDQGMTATQGTEPTYMPQTLESLRNTHRRFGEKATPMKRSLSLTRKRMQMRGIDLINESQLVRRIHEIKIQPAKSLRRLLNRINKASTPRRELLTSNGEQRDIQAE